MPAAIEYLTPNDNRFRKLRTAVEKERRTRQTEIVAARNYYSGAHWRPLHRDQGVDHNTIINLCRQTVDRMVAFLFSAMPTLELQETRETKAEKDLRKAWDEAGGVLLLQDMAQSGALAGHVFSKVVPGATEDVLPRIVNLDPALVSVYWRPDDIGEVVWYSIEWGGGYLQTTYRQDIINRGETWEILDWEKTGSEWKQVGKPVVWKSALGPIVDWAHEAVPFQYYGLGELRHRDLNDKINKLASDISKVMHHHAGPKTIGTGVGDAEVVASGVENFWTIKKADAKVFNLTLPADALEPGLNYLQFLERQFLAESRVVRLAGDISDFQRVTNLGVKILYGDQISKNAELQRRYERGIQGISQRLLTAMSYTAERPAIHWADPLPQDPMQTMLWLEKARLQGLVSKETMSYTLNLDYDLEQVRQLDDGTMEMLLMESLTNSPGFGVSGAIQAASGNGDVSGVGVR